MPQYKKLQQEELVVLAQRSDYKALEELIRREQKNVFAAFSYLCKKKENVSDLTQEALFRVAKSIQTLKNPKCFKSWLNHIISNLFYDELRKIKRCPECISIDDDCEVKIQIPDVKCKPYEKCALNELEKVIRQAIHELPEPFRIVIILRELQGLSYDEIADVTKSSVGTVKSRISRAREKLQDGLRAYI